MAIHSLPLRGSLPNERMPLGKMLALSLQLVVATLPATALVPLLVGLPVPNALLGAGLATVVAAVLSRWTLRTFIPLFYGASFSFIAAMLAITKVTYGQPASAHNIALVSAGVFAVAVIELVTGLVVKKAGIEALHRFLPPVITGPTAIVIGLSLAGTAVNSALGKGEMNNLVVTVITLGAAMFAAVYLRKGLVGQLPILLAVVVGYAVSVLLRMVDFTPLSQAQLIVAPTFIFPAFNSAESLGDMIAMGCMALAVIPEMIAHLVQQGIYVDQYAERRDADKPNLEQHQGANLILAAIGDFICAFLNAMCGTSYGEGNAVSALTDNYSGFPFIGAGVIVAVLSLSGHLTAFFTSIPGPVIGAIEIIMFGAIATQGVTVIKLQMQDRDMFSPRNLILMGIILIVGLGSSTGYLPIPLLQSIFPNGWPAIATGVFLGIVVNLIFELVKPPVEETAAV